MGNEDVQKTLEELSRNLQESKARLEEAQRVAHLGHWEWDLETDAIVWSDETYRIFGLSPQERPMDLATVQSLVHPEDREALYGGVDEDLVAGIRPDAEFRIVRPNGEVRTVHALTSRRWSFVPGDAKRDSAGRPYKLFGTVQDITERKRAEEALQLTQAHFREGQRLARMGSWTSDGTKCQWSDELFPIYGLDPRKGVPSTEEFLTIIHPQDRPSMAEAIRLMLEEERGCDVTTRVIRPDGQMRYVRCVGIRIVEQGIFKGFLGTGMDVTEQEILTQELRRERAYLTEAQSLAHLGSWACNLVTQKIFHSSDENARLYGFDPREGAIPFDRFYNTILTEDEAALRPKLENAIRTGADYDVEFRIQRTDGAIRFMRGIGHHNPSQEVGEYLGITIDITERKRAEEGREKLRQLEADLAHMNRVNMMGELAAALAHEIKQPITAAVTNAGACLRFLEMERPDILEAREAASGTIGCGTRAAEIIDRVRALFKKTAPQREPVNINELIREIALLLQNEIRRHSVVVHLGLAENLPEVMADRVQLQQVLMNLMLNAIEAMQGVSAHLEINSQQTDDGQLLIAVSDTGLGLPTEKADQIFDAFFTTKPQGTGMGLAISRSIVESHGGRLWASSNSGRGATFRFTLPYEESLRT
ncbi:MAG TPA: PAS domain-containing protein [Terriglobales bacterium]|nr:PAS domain-containing protein [Terriglobales bacterium]